jgi:HEAT repeat protein
VFSRNFVGALIVVVTISTFGSSQGDRMATVAESLRRHNVALTKDSLVAALRSSDDEVRALAALQLAQDKAIDTVPFVAEALASEKVARTLLDIAIALAQLGDKRGSAALTAMCEDNHANASLRLAATINLLNLGDDSCWSVVLEILQSTADHDYVTSALVLVPRFQHIDKADLRMLFELVVRALGDEEPNVRINAGYALVKLGNVSAVPYLETAIANEHEDAVRSQLQADLRKLRQKAE